jgi:hypothetical protein
VSSIPANNLNKIVYLIALDDFEVDPDSRRVGAFRLIDFATSTGRSPEEFSAQLLETSPGPLLHQAAASTEPILVLERDYYEITVDALREETQSHGLTAYTVGQVEAAHSQAYRERMAKLAVEQPTLVTSITIEGSELRDMYDEHPGLAYFSSSTSVGVRVPKPLPMAEAMDTAIAAWKKINGDDNGDELDDDEDDDYDGKFSASRIVLYNAGNEVIQEFNGSTWITEFAPADQWDSLLERAKALDAEASEESRWDNFSTATNYREQATELRRQVSIARANLSATAEATPSEPAAASAPATDEGTGPLSRTQVLFAKRAAMGTAFFVAMPDDDDYGFDRLMKMQSTDDLKRATTTMGDWGAVYLHESKQNRSVFDLKNDVFGVATDMLHNLSGLSPDVAIGELTRYATTVVPHPEGCLTDIPHHKVTVGKQSPEAALANDPSPDM